ncbi:hypothetical protein [Cyanothece sp. BG0011]|uniref:hypothetical protein n=1 Tax=Cyanothece sp. BG0011 TaxID=2082950 RepID=UPI0030DB465E
MLKTTSILPKILLHYYHYALISEKIMIISFLKRFSTGALLGLILGGLSWYNSKFFGHSIPLSIGISGCLLLSLLCGLIIAKFGYKGLESLLNSFYE